MPRRSPRPHIVHTHHPRYYLKLYSRGSRIEEMPESMDYSTSQLFEFTKFDTETLENKIILDGIGKRDEYFIEKAFAEADRLNERERLEEKKRILRIVAQAEKEAKRRGFSSLGERYKNLRLKLTKLSKRKSGVDKVLELSSQMSKASDKGDWSEYYRLKKEREKITDVWLKAEVKDTKILEKHQVVGGAYEERLHDIILQIGTERYSVPSVPQRTIDRLEREGRLSDLIKLSGTKQLR